MTTVLAAVNGSPATGPVLAVASAMASLLRGSVDVIHVAVGIGEGDEPGPEPSLVTGQVDIRILHGDPVDEIVVEAANPEVTLVVVGARRRASGARPAGHVALAVVERSVTPVLVVPPDTTVAEGSRTLGRVLVPLEGTIEGSEAVADIVQRLGEAGVQLLGVHVFDPADAPAFWGEPGHTERSWASAFLGQWSVTPSLELRLRRGEVADAILDLTRAENIDLVALAWARNLEPGRAEVVRAVVAQSDVPVLLVPVDGER
jgi:nucleotide-binding universal stress UspA family protein